MASVQRLFTHEELETILLGFTIFHNWKKEDVDYLMPEELSISQDGHSRGITIYKRPTSTVDAYPIDSCSCIYANLYLLIGITLHASPGFMEYSHEFNAFMTMVTHGDAIEIPSTMRPPSNRRYRNSSW